MSLGTAVIVGVGPGLGLELARTFANAGHPVAMLARDKAKLDTLRRGARRHPAWTPAATSPTPPTRSTCAT